MRVNDIRVNYKNELINFSAITYIRSFVKKLLIIIPLIFFNFITSKGQYFSGPNKPDYKVFDYKVYKTPHFEIYYYFKDDSLINLMSEIAEKWYLRHQQIFKDTFKERNPIILYSNHADFQQTNAIMENIGVGTGGVTEALKNRVVLPLMESAAQTDHVLGHELVHAFQYRLLLGEDSTQQKNIRNIPLWMVEGMAEYLSLGSHDPFTSMWMRDALVNKDFPTLDDLTKSYKYFPYRYGQAFWAYITGLYSDTIIMPLFDLSTKIGYDRAIDSLTHLNEKEFSKKWKKQTKDFYFGLLKDTVEKTVGKRILYEKNSGTINIAPSFSPDGKYIGFISEKDLFTFDLFKADANTGKHIKKLSSTIRDNKIDDFNYLESGGTWSPDGKKFAFSTFSKGKNKLLIIDTRHPRKAKEIEINGVESFSNPNWSPDGKSLIVCGLKQGVTDLYLYNFESKSTENLTNDVYCNLMPAWSPDGKKIAFSTDRPAKNYPTDTIGYRIAIMDLETRNITVIPVLNKADNLNAQYSYDNKNIYFLSNADGYRNLYRYSLDSLRLYRLTKLITGISGVTNFTPAISTNRQNGNILYVHYYKTNYDVYFAPDTAFTQELINTDSINETAGYLPPVRKPENNLVNNNVEGLIKQPLVPVDSFKTEKYKSKFQLDYIGGSSVGIGVSSYYGTGMAGSVDMLFSDMVGNYQLYSSLAVNGRIYDFGGSVAFLNNKNKIDWGVSLSHIPNPYNYISISSAGDTLNNNLNWIFQDELSLFAIRPISQTKRIEAYTIFSYYSQHAEKEIYVYDSTINQYIYYATNRRAKSQYSNFGIAAIGVAYTLDNAYMGIASPLRGQRFHLGTEYNTGDLKFLNVTADYRRYLFFNPVCIATRLYHVGRYGYEKKEDNFITALYLGWPWLVRGFDYRYVSNMASKNDTTSLNLLYGSRIAVANFELRVPLTGPERLCLIPFKYFISELSFFADGGIAWDSHRKIALKNKNFADYSSPIGSYGVSLRINVFGYLILEPYYAIPMQKDGRKSAGFGLNFLPGW